MTNTNDFDQYLIDLNKGIDSDRGLSLLEHRVNNTFVYCCAHGFYQKQPNILSDIINSTSQDMGELLDAARAIYMPLVNEARTGVSIYTDSRKLTGGVRTPMKFSKFLRLIGVVDNEDIKEMANKFNATYCQTTKDVKIIEGNKIANVYLLCGQQGGGVSSCMTYSSRSFDMPEDVHPTDAYSSPDVALAYMEDAKGRIVGRTLLNTINKSFVRVYGSPILKELLKQMGYTEGDLKECRIAKVPVEKHGEEGYALPYIDGDAYFLTDYDEDYFICDYDGDINTTTEDFHQEAFVNSEYQQGSERCSTCGDTLESETMYSEYHDMTICESCVDHGSWVYGYINEDQDYIDLDTVHAYNHNGVWYIEEALSYHNLVVIDGDVYEEHECAYDDLVEEYVAADADDMVDFVDSGGNEGQTEEDNVRDWFRMETISGSILYSREEHEYVTFEGDTYYLDGYEEEDAG